MAWTHRVIPYHQRPGWGARCLRLTRSGWMARAADFALNLFWCALRIRDDGPWFLGAIAMLTGRSRKKDRGSHLNCLLFFSDLVGPSSKSRQQKQAVHAVTISHEIRWSHSEKEGGEKKETRKNDSLPPEQKWKTTVKCWSDSLYSYHSRVIEAQRCTNDHDLYPHHPEPDHQRGERPPRFLISSLFSYLIQKLR